MPPLVDIDGLSFSFNGVNILSDVNLCVNPNERIMIYGANGAGKTTLLRILGGLHIVNKYETFQVLGSSTPNDQCRGLAYLGDRWERSVPFAGTSPYTGDVRVGDMMKTWQNDYRERRDELVDVLGIDLDWRMHQVSDGQRKKVQIMLGLLQPFKLLVIDEFLNSLDIIVRDRFYKYVDEECRREGASVVYATHIFDNLDKWMDKVMHIRHGVCNTMQNMGPFLNNRTLFESIRDELQGERNEEIMHIDHSAGYTSGRGKQK